MNTKQIFTTDQFDNIREFSKTGKALLQTRETILLEWEKKVRSEIWPAQALAHPILIDTLPAFLDNMAEALSPEHPRWKAASGTTLAQEHGGERARLTAFSPDQIVREYQLLRQVVTRELKKVIDVSDEEVEIINSSIDSAMAEAVMSFAISESSIREQLISSLSEDLRAPLEATRMLVDLIISEADHPQEVSRLVGRARENLENAEHLIRDLTDVAVVRSGKKIELKPMEEEMGRVVKLALRSHEKNGVKFDIKSEKVEGRWDAPSLCRAFDHIIGTLLKHRTDDEPITIKISETHGRVLVSIHQSTGEIPVDQQEAIFQIFRRRLKGPTESTRAWDVGLPVARAIAESHGGTLLIDSGPKRGTTFMLDIPVDCRPYMGAPISDPPQAH